MTAYNIFLSDNPENGMVSWQMGKLSTTAPARNSYVRTFLCFQRFLVCQRVSVDYAFRGRTDYLFPRAHIFLNKMEQIPSMVHDDKVSLQPTRLET